MEEIKKIESEKAGSKEYNKVLEWIIIILMGLSCINLFTQAIGNVLMEDYLALCLQFFGGVINFYAFYLIYKRKIVGVYLFFIMMVLQIPVNYCFGYIDSTIIISAIVRIVFVSLLLLISRKGETAWKLLWNNQNGDEQSRKRVAYCWGGVFVILAILGIFMI